MNIHTTMVKIVNGVIATLKSEIEDCQDDQDMQKMYKSDLEDAEAVYRLLDGVGYKAAMQKIDRLDTAARDYYYEEAELHDFDLNELEIG